MYHRGKNKEILDMDIRMTGVTRHVFTTNDVCDEVKKRVHGTVLRLSV